MSKLTNQNFNLLTTFTTRITHTTALQYKYPEIGDVMGVGSETITVTADNQKEFSAPYLLEEDEITLLAAGFENRISLTQSIDDEKGWLLEVVGTLLTSDKLTVTVSKTVQADDEDQAIEVFENELEGYELHCLEFRDNDTNEIYYIEVDSIHNEEWGFEVID